ncbi:MAG TPA: zinc-dependent metalloprotease [Mycobacteriales bacterium]|nr:zinc-dependent metalloprotease [Mycobacteriales bacterium]
MPTPIDFDLAIRTAARLAPTGPQVSRSDAAAAVTELRSLAQVAEEHVRAVTGLVPPGEPDVATVVDRPAWAQANIEGFSVVLEPLVDALSDKSNAVTAKVAGVQMGTFLAWLSSKVLGQYEVFLPAGRAGRVLLVAPNIVETERRLGVQPHDFRLWVALHEVTHRTQFTAVPWLHDHVASEVAALLKASSLDDPKELVARLRSALSQLPQGKSVVELLQTPEQRVVLDRVTAFMSLLEGHAEHVMDGVGPAVVPTVAEIRAKFDQRRKEGSGHVDRLLRKLLGLDLKALQYAEGKRFVDAVVGEVGMAGFNQVWGSPSTLPTRQEIREPMAWVRRVHGAAASA